MLFAGCGWLGVGWLAVRCVFLCLLLCGFWLGVFLVLEVCALVTLVRGFICCVSFFVLLCCSVLL